ncbi:hypothetical protein tb265_25240 [Gemmatimonadetes bacterium T265]|nr:hypothetical protein tb265_25240 [Gemmatimonadetes bacterium T265]
MFDQALAYQLASLVGAVMILAAYVAYQRGGLGREHRRYNALNFVGSAILAWVAVVDRRWGFIVLEGSWALLSLPPLLRPPRAGGPHA